MPDQKASWRFVPRGFLVRMLLLASLTLLFGGFAFAAEPAKPPKIVLIGDSIRLGYAPEVAKKLEGKAIVVGPKANGGDSGNVLKNLNEWAVKEQPDIVHFN